MKKMDDSVRFLKNVWALTRSYWQSEEKKKAYLLLFAIVALTLGVVFMLVQLNQWYNIFYSALQNYEKDKIFAELFHFSWLAFIYIILAVYAFYLQQILIINWRRWLTNQYIDEWLEHKTYYRLQMFGTATDNPDQRISEDVRMFVEYTLRFGIGILKAFTTFASFVVILYNLSGPLQFKVAGMDIHIPGYLVWTALLYSIAGTWLTYKVGNKLVGLNFVQQKYEADFRFAMMRMRENAESVAFYSGEGHEGSVFKKRFTLLLDNFWNIIKKQKQLTWLNSWYSQIAIIFPLVVAMPRYLAKEITLGGLMQISSAFGRVQESLSYFVDMYSSIAEWQAVVERLTGFGLHMQQVKQENAQKDLDRKVSPSEDIIAREMDVDLPDGSSVLKQVSFTLEPGTNVLIKGVSGSGKSTLLRTMLGLQEPMAGKIVLGEGMRRNEIGYLPQQTFVQRDFPASVREVVLSGCQGRCGLRPFYNREEKGIADKAMAQMEITSLADACYRDLSGGQQQRVLLARALCASDKMLVLDEPVSGLDPKMAEAMYRLVARINKEMGITIVMISHDVREAIPYATHILHMDRDFFFGTAEEYRQSKRGKLFLS